MVAPPWRAFFLVVKLWPFESRILFEKLTILVAGGYFVFGVGALTVKALGRRSLPCLHVGDNNNNR